MTSAVVRRVGEKVGKVLEVKVNEGGSCMGQFACVRVVREIADPLERSIKIEREDGGEEWIVIIRYERLPEFCSVCGRVRHLARHCSDGTTDRASPAFSLWLRAGRVMDTRRPRNVSTGHVQSDSRSSGSPRGSRSATGPGSTEGLGFKEKKGDGMADSGGGEEVREMSDMVIRLTFGTRAAAVSGEEEVLGKDEGKRMLTQGMEMEMGRRIPEKVPELIGLERPGESVVKRPEESVEEKRHLEPDLAMRKEETSSTKKGAMRRWKMRARLVGNDVSVELPSRDRTVKRKKPAREESKPVAKLARHEVQGDGIGRKAADDMLITAVATEQ